MQKLPKELKELVHFVISILGNEVEKLYGKETFLQVESIRKAMKRGREAPKKLPKEIYGLYEKLSTLSNDELKRLAHIYSIYLELINHCESAFRCAKLRGKIPVTFKKIPENLIYVFTAHPTESRSENAQKLFMEIEKTILTHSLSKEHSCDQELSFYIRLLLMTTLSNQEKPTLVDEANHIYSIILSNKMIAHQIKMKEKGIAIRYRAWIGGDKDGHPYVDETTTETSLSLSRKAIVSFIRVELKTELELFHSLDESSERGDLLKNFSVFLEKINSLESLVEGDDLKVLDFINLTSNLNKRFNSPLLKKVLLLVDLYPALVVPLEFREDSKQIHEALKDPTANISRMLGFLKKIAKPKHIYRYVRGFIVSMTESEKDLFAARDLQIKMIGATALPIVPLFEKRSALEKSEEIITNFLTPEVKHEITSSFGHYFEVMLGYSDSSKESGVLEGRWLIANSLNNLDKLLTRLGLTPLFFHGSGGSIERGGGSVREQTQWWPTSALNNYKVTIQGEMVERNFSNPLIMESQVEKIIENFSTRKGSSRKMPAAKSLELLAHNTSKIYEELLQSKRFIQIVKEATPYPYLDALKIGSRPSKKTTPLDENLKLRAIPWVLCWTQTRTLLPTWYGIGTAFFNLKKEDQIAIIESFEESHFLRSFIKILGFTLAKVELSIFELYIDKLASTPQSKELYEQLALELLLVKKFFTKVSGQKNYLWYRPWLLESIELRGAMIHPLNVIQIIAMKRENLDLLKESVAGIACGMMTTG